jgi:death on curing protein
MRLLLLQNGQDITASEEEKYDFVISIAAGEVKFDQIVNWLNAHLKNGA